MARFTLLDAAALNGNDRVVGLIEESLPYSPEFQIFPMRNIVGTSYYTSTRTGRPTVAFRDLNEGVTPSKSTFVKKLVECFILSARVEADAAHAQTLEEGPAYWEMIEAKGVMIQALLEVASQIWYGITTDAKGFPGVKASTPFGGATTVNSGGSDANVQSSLYAVKFGVQDVTLIGGNSSPVLLSEFRSETIYDAADLPFPGRVADLMGWIGMQIGNVNAVGRICNIGQDSETGDLLTDAKIATLLALFPIGYRPDALFASRRSIAQLQRSRTFTVFAGGSGTPASIEMVGDLPDSAFGIPLYASDSILNTDAVES